MNDFTLSKDEYIEFITFKKDKLLRQAQALEQTLDELLGKKEIEKNIHLNNISKTSSHVLSSNKFPGWKYFVDEVLLHANASLYANEITALVLKNPDLKSKTSVAKKSIGSVLSMNSQPHKNRYIWTKDKRGIKQYTFNKDFIEKE